MIPCKFSFPLKGHWFLLVCLNLVQKKVFKLPLDEIPRRLEIAATESKPAFAGFCNWRSQLRMRYPTSTNPRRRISSL